MGLKYIIDSDAVIARMGLPDVSGVAETIDSHLTAAHIRFQGLLETTFEPNNSIDTFWLQSGRFPVVLDNYFNLRLKKGFIKYNTFVVVVKNSLTDNGVQISVPDCMINLEKGIVYIDSFYKDKYITVSYSSGFDETNKPPIWLKEALLAYMPYLLNNQQSTNRSNESESTAIRIADISGEMVAPYMRGRAFQYMPMF